MSARELAGELAIVTGAAQGIGAAIARKLAAHGAAVALADRQVEKAQAVASEIVAAGGKAQAFAVDISQLDSVLNLREAVRSRLGRATVLVNNAAIIPVLDFLSLSWADWDRTLQTNVSGAFYCSRVFIDDMLAEGRGNIIIISSVRWSMLDRKSRAELRSAGMSVGLMGVKEKV